MKYLDPKSVLTFKRVFEMNIPKKDIINLTELSKEV